MTDRPLYLRDQERRVLANLSQPRSVTELARQLAADPFAPFDKRLSLSDLGNEISGVLAELAGHGLVKNLGLVMNAEQAVSLTSRDGDVPTMHPEKADQFVDRFGDAGKDAHKLREGDLWYWTDTGQRLLTTT